MPWAGAGGGTGAGGGVRGGVGAAGGKWGKFCFPLYEDLTKLNLEKIKAILQDPGNLAINGLITFILVNSEAVRRVRSFLDHLDTVWSDKKKPTIVNILELGS